MYDISSEKNQFTHIQRSRQIIIYRVSNNLCPLRFYQNIAHMHIIRFVLILAFIWHLYNVSKCSVSREIHAKMNKIAYNCRKFAKKSEKSNFKKSGYMKEFSRFNGGLYDIHKTMADPFWKVLAVVCFENRGFLSRTGVNPGLKYVRKISCPPLLFYHWNSNLLVYFIPFRLHN